MVSMSSLNTFWIRSLYCNYKVITNIALVTVVDMKYSFTYIDEGCNGWISDWVVFFVTSLYQVIKFGAIPESFVLKQYIFLGKLFIKNVFRKSSIVKAKNVDYRLSWTRRIVKNAFVILALRFWLFDKLMFHSPANVMIVNASLLMKLTKTKKSKQLILMRSKQRKLRIKNYYSWISELFW